MAPNTVSEYSSMNMRQQFKSRRTHGTGGVRVSDDLTHKIISKMKRSKINGMLQFGMVWCGMLQMSRIILTTPYE